MQHLTSNDVSILTAGLGQYSLLCNSDGGIKDDILVLKIREEEFLIVYNAANRSGDYDWFVANSPGFDVKIEDISNEVAMFAVQGPRAVRLITEMARDAEPAHLPRFGCAWAEIEGFRVLLSRTGYTGEDGFEVLVFDSPVEDAKRSEIVWETFLRAGKPMGLEPCGLGARDLLRLEAGLCLYGTDIDEKTTPYEARLGFVVKLRKEFIGRSKLQEEQQNGPRKLRVGLVMQRRVIPRHGFNIANGDNQIGNVTSGTLSPIVNNGIALGYVQRESAGEGSVVDVLIRNKREPARITKPPFYETTKYGYTRKTT